MYQKIIEKLTLQSVTLDQRLTANDPTICFFDIDGTIFTAGWRIIFAPLYNLQTRRILKKHHIPYVLISGRQELNELIPHEMALHGFNNYDAMVLGAGTVIHYRTENDTFAIDEQWRKKLKDTGWNHDELKARIQKIKKDYVLPFDFIAGNSYLVRIAFKDIPVERLKEIAHILQKNVPQGVRIDWSESLLAKNTETVFSGNFLIMPEIAGKDNAVKYLLSTIRHEPSAISQKRMTTFLFGDALVDIPMLNLTSEKTMTFKPYLVHPTPLARLAAKERRQITILESEGPQAILGIMKKESGVSGIPLTTPAYFSPAQNNPLRRISQFLEPVLNKLVDPSLSPNDISRLGIEKVQKALQLSKSHNIFLNITAVWLYLTGNLLDLLDGIRSRQKKYTQDIPGQLMDGYSDRAREFYALYSRGKKRSISHMPYAISTYRAALSCFLPSIARAQAEIMGIAVPERDQAGGSALDRSKLLIKSFILHTFGLETKSYEIDQEIYRRNMATFENRLNFITQKNTKNILSSIQDLKINNIPQFQKEALERFLLYVDLLQQANSVILQTEKISLPTHNDILQQYLGFPIVSLRKKFRFHSYPLTLF